MRRSVWIFLASILLPSLGLAWLAVRSVRDQQVVLEHQQVIISQNITDALAKSIQAQMDQVRGDFVKTTQQLLGESSSPQVLAESFNRKLRDAWPMAEIGFAVNLDGEIYSPNPYDGPDAKTFRDENDRFLSNRENVEVYSSNSLVANQNVSAAQNASANFSIKLPEQAADITDKMKKLASSTLDSQNVFKNETALLAPSKDDNQNASLKGAIGGSVTQTPPVNQNAAGAGSETDLAIDSLRSAASAKTPAPAAAYVSDQSTSDASKLKSVAPVQPMSDGATLVPAATDAAALPPQPPPTMSGSTGSAAPSMSAAAASANLTTATATISVPVASTATTTQAPALMPSGGTETITATPAATSSGGADTGQAGKTPAAAAVISTPASHFGSVETGMPNNNAEMAFAKIQRQVIPQQMLTRETASLSNTVPEESDFRRLISTEASGEVARFLENKMRLMVWSHATPDMPIVFGAQLDQGKLVEALKASFQIPELARDSSSRSGKSETCVAILDDTGHPVALSQAGFQGDWKHPFVATEIGEVLPHWEAALYLVDPQQISRAARTLQATLGLIVLVLVAAIVSGGSLIAADVRRQVRLAQQKTDFVSNVSHELKTPLTSIRMFADLLAEKRVPDEERQATYLRIIAAEAARLTRLINNVLDFARLDRGAPGDLPPGEHRACDLVDAVRDVVETCGPHLEAAGISFQYEVEAETLPIRGDQDGLAQIILNLISNAEKYGGNDILVRVRRQETAAGALGCVDVLDRGPGIPAKQVRTVFEPFHRLDDSLSSGIPGSGLGLTLARRMARAHGGDVTYSPRAGGGSCFTLTVPLGVAA